MRGVVGIGALKYRILQSEVSGRKKKVGEGDIIVKGRGGVVTLFCFVIEMEGLSYLQLCFLWLSSWVYALLSKPCSNIGYIESLYLHAYIYIYILG